MQTFDKSIFGLLQQELITYDEAIRYASNAEDFKLMVQGVRRGTEGEVDDPSGSDDSSEIIRYSR